MKQVNFFERKYNTRIETPQPEEIITDARFVQTVEKCEITKKLLRKSNFVPTDRKGEMDKYRVSDFALENLLEVGATLKPCSLSTSQFTAVRNLESKLASIPEPTKPE